MIAHTAREQVFMNSVKRFGILALSALVGGACEDITNPVEEFGELTGPFVRFETSQAVGTPGSQVNVIFQMPTRVEEDVEIEFAFGGNAVFGQDFRVVDREGNTRTDVTAAGGTAVIPYRFDQTAFGRDTLRVVVPFEAADGRTLEVEIVEARTVTGRPVETGFIERYRLFNLNIEGFVDVPTGTYVGQRTGDFGTAAAQVTISKPATPIVIDGIGYQFEISDYSGDGSLFGVGVPWAFSVTSGGTVELAPRSHVFGTVTSDVSGSFDFATGRLSLNITLTCCGAEGFGWQLAVTHE